jgi:TolA-binding protein
VEAIAALREARTMSAPGCIRDSELPHEYYAVGMAQIVGGQHVAAAETFAELSRWAEVQDKGDWQAILPDALVEEADQLIRAGKTREGAAVYDEFLHRYPRRPDSVTIAYARVCAIHDGPEHLKPADLLAICSAYPTDTGAAQGVVYQLGESYIMVDQYQEALTVLRRVYNFRPKPGDKLDQPDMPATAGSQMVVCYCALGQIKEAEAAVADLEHRFPSNHDEVTTAGDFVESYKAQRRER